MNFRSPDQIELDALRDEVRALLAQCTEEQRLFFLRVYPVGIENMNREALRNAVGLCQRTIQKNQRNAVS